jgi:hypothetical protein
MQIPISNLIEIRRHFLDMSVHDLQSRVCFIRFIQTSDIENTD